MLTFFATGPLATGRYIVAYLTPGCAVLTVAGDCPTAGTAKAEADRMNLAQINREKVLRAERHACGIRYYN